MSIWAISPSTQTWNAYNGEGNEQENNLAIAERLVQLLREVGEDARLMTRGLGDPRNGYISQVAESNENHADYHIDLHTDAGGATGTSVFYHSTSEEGRRLAQCVFNEIAPLSPGEDSGVRSNDGLYAINGTEAIAILVEAAPHDVDESAEWIRNNHEAIAQAYFRGICNFKGIGIITPTPAPVPQPMPKPNYMSRVPANFPLPFPLPSGHFFGDIMGGENSHGGFYKNERQWVKAIQQGLIMLGCVPGVTNSNYGWADGLYEQATVDAVVRFQSMFRADSTNNWGQIWDDDLVTMRDLLES